MNSVVTTHVLDTATGRPAAGMPVRLCDDAGGVLFVGFTDTDGRIADLGPSRLQSGTYRLTFDCAAYFGELPYLHPEVTIAFVLDEGQDHYHLPLLLAPFGYTTYRGS